MKKTLLCLLMGGSLLSCAQNKNTNNPAISDLYKEVKFENKSIQYRVGIQVAACNFNLFINDVPVVQNFEETSGTFNTSAPVNDVILKSGKQHFKLILYPGFKNGLPLPALAKNILAKITVEGLKYEGEGVKTLIEPFTILEIGGEGKKFTEKGKTTAVYEGTFEAKVPYVLSAWSGSKDLRKEDPVTLKKEVLAFYQQYINIVKEKDENALTNLIYAKEKNYAQALFLNQDGSQAQWDAYLDLIRNPTLVMMPLEKYQMNFYANGRLVTLERIDYPNIGEPALRSESQENGRTVVGFYFCQLHKREGSNQLELIH